jgi:osmotically inducible protein OsmC
VDRVVPVSPAAGSSRSLASGAGTGRSASLPPAGRSLQKEDDDDKLVRADLEQDRPHRPSIPQARNALVAAAQRSAAPGWRRSGGAGEGLADTGGTTMTTRSASARYDGLGKEGRGHVSLQSGVLTEQPYGFGTRFGEEPGTNPEELVAAAHAACFTMALSFALAKEGYGDGTLETTARVTLDKDGDGFTVTRSALSLEATVPGIDPARFEEIAQGAKAGCPISKLLKAEITLDHRLSS